MSRNGVPEAAPEKYARRGVYIEANGGGGTPPPGGGGPPPPGGGGPPPPPSLEMTPPAHFAHKVQIVGLCGYLA